MPKLSFMKWFPGDWLRDTRILSAEAKGVWIDILCMAWNEPERGVYTRSKIDFCRELQILPKRYTSIIEELAKVGGVTFRNDLITVTSRRMSKLDKAYKLASERQARFRSNANVTRHVTAKTLDVRRSQDVRLLKTTAGSPPLDASLSEYVNGWKAKPESERKERAAEVAEGLKKFKLGYRVEDDLYNQIVGSEAYHGGTAPIHRKSIFEQAAERKRTQGLTSAGGLIATGEAGSVFSRLRDLPKVSPKTGIVEGGGTTEDDKSA